MKPLFPQIGLVHGGDYNPEQWLDRPDILAEDIRLMREAGMNSASVGIFSWSVLEPHEGAYNLQWLVEIVNRLYQNGIHTVLATPSGAMPAWLAEKYPEAMRVQPNERRNHYGQRHNHCPSSPAYRERVAAVVCKLAEALGGHPGVMLWHISNEFGGECWCDRCRARFTEFLRERYHDDIDALNHAWWTTFWSHRYTDFTQIEPPWPNGERSTLGLLLDWKRFCTWNLNDYLRFEVDLLRDLTPGVPVTTNFMHLYPGIDYHKMAPNIDVISWDSYPFWGTDAETQGAVAATTAFSHAMMRSMKPDRPFMLMESTPSHVNWSPVNKLKRPGIHRLQCLQAIGCGSDTVQYFQWRKSRGSFEQHHGAVVDHLGRNDTRVFREVAEVGALLGRLSEVAGSVPRAKAALLYDWDNRWAIDDMKGLSADRRNYVETCIAQYEIFHRRGIAMDVVSPLADLSPYRVVVAPMLYMLKPGVAEKLRAFVQAGGRLVATYLTGYVNESTLCFLGGFPGDGLTALFGLYTEEIDALYPSDRNAVRFEAPLSGEAEARDFCEVIRPLGCQTIGSYQSDYIAGTPAVTRNAYGEGSAWYVAARLSDGGMETVYRAVWNEAGLAPVDLPEDVTFYSRETESARFDFYLNWRGEPRTVAIADGGFDLIAGCPAPVSLPLPALGAAVVRRGL